MQKTQNSKTSEKLLTLAECQELTGRKIPTWRKDIYMKKVPVVRLGRGIRIPKEFVDKLIADGWQDPVGA